MPEFRVAASTFPFLYTMSALDALKHLRELGYSDFELMIFPPHCWPPEITDGTKAEIKSWMNGEGASFSSFCYPLQDNNPNSCDKIMRDYTLDRYKEMIDLAAEFDCPYVIAIPGPVSTLINPPQKWMVDWFVESMQSLVAHAEGTGVDILLENVPGTCLPTTKELVDAAKAIGPNIGINFDICNSAFIREDVGSAIRMMGSMLGNVHISDSGFEEFKHDRLGTGIVDPAPAMEALKEIGYDGMTVMEIITDAAAPDADPDADIRASHEILASHGWASI